MTYRRREAMRFVELLWIIKQAGKTRIGFLSNKYIPPQKVGTLRMY